MNINQFLCISFLLCFFATAINCMEKGNDGKKLLSYEEFQHLKNISLEYIKQSHGDFTQRNESCSWVCHQAVKKHRTYTAQLALRTTMPNLRKLQYLIGDNYWEARKKIFTALIEDEKYHPDTINYFFISPLQESINFNDKSFTEYLLQKGAIVSSKILESASSQEMLSLLQSHLNN